MVATCYLLGVSTRGMDKLVETLGITSLSKSQVSVMAKELDTTVEAFRTRPLDAGPYTFMAADALVLKDCETLLATAEVHCGTTGFTHKRAPAWCGPGLSVGLWRYAEVSTPICVSGLC